MILGNNTQVEDFFNGIKFENSIIKENVIELTFHLNSKKQINSFINSKKFIEKIVSSAKDVGYKKVLARFKFVKHSPSKEEQKNLLKIQNEFFDELSVQLIGEKFDVFKEMIGYAEENFDKKISPVIDLQFSTLLTPIINYLKSLNIDNIRWIYHKLSVCYGSYELVNSLMQNSEISNYIVDCSRRCGLVYEDIDARNIATPILLKLLFNFDGFCFRYYPARKDKNGKIIGFPNKEIWKFNPKTYEFELIPNKDYRINRSLDYQNLNQILSKKTIPQTQKLVKLLSHFQKS